MTDRPTHLVIVTHAGQAGLELFSAHYTEDAAKLMLARLERLLSATGSRAHLIEVPEIEGVADIGELPPLPAPSLRDYAPSPAPPPPPAEKPAPFRQRSRAEFAAETEAAEMNGGIVTDTPMPKYDGAFS